MESKQSYREVMGERLREFRKERGLSLYKVSQNGGIGIDQAKAVEDGSTNYTVDILLGYVKGCDLYLYFATKDDRGEEHDFDDLAKKGVDNHPDNVR